MIPEHWRQPKIIRLVAAAGLVALAGRAAGAETQSASCVPCLVIGIEGPSLKLTGELPSPRSLEGLRVLVMAPMDSAAAREVLQIDG